ncbi:MAG: hypothetical protein ACODAJ_15325 [Planctomycetota bacterium]
MEMTPATTRWAAGLALAACFAAAGAAAGAIVSNSIRIIAVETRVEMQATVLGRIEDKLDRIVERTK